MKIQDAKKQAAQILRDEANELASVNDAIHRDPDWRADIVIGAKSIPVTRRARLAISAEMQRLRQIADTLDPR